MHCARTCAYACFGCVLAADTARESICTGVGPCAAANLYFYGVSTSYTWYAPHKAWSAPLRHRLVAAHHRTVMHARAALAQLAVATRVHGSRRRCFGWRRLRGRYTHFGNGRGCAAPHRSRGGCGLHHRSTTVHARGAQRRAEGIGSAGVAASPASTDEQECLAPHVRVRMVGCTIFTLTFCVCVGVNAVAAGGVDGGGGFGTANGWTIIHTI